MRPSAFPGATGGIPFDSPPAERETQGGPVEPKGGRSSTDAAIEYPTPARGDVAEWSAAARRTTVVALSTA